MTESNEMEGFRKSLADVEDVLIQAEQNVDGFLFTARFETDGGTQLRSTIGTNPAREGFDPTEALAMSLLVLADQTDTHPAALGHQVIEQAREKANSF